MVTKVELTEAEIRAENAEWIRRLDKWAADESPRRIPPPPPPTDGRWERSSRTNEFEELSE